MYEIKLYIEYLSFAAKIIKKNVLLFSSLVVKSSISKENHIYKKFHQNSPIIFGVSINLVFKINLSCAVLYTQWCIILHP